MLEKISEIQFTIDSLDAQRAQLETALAEAKTAAREHVVMTVRDMIAEAGFTPEEILPLVAPQTAKTAKARGDGRAFPTYALNNDPSVTYRRGVLPEKLKAAMVAAGYDPAQSAQRVEFKTIYMTPVADTR